MNNEMKFEKNGLLIPNGALEELGLSGISLSAWLGQDHILLMPQEMTAEQLLWAWCKSELLCLKRLVFRSDSYYYTAMQPAMQAGLRKKKQCKKRKRGKPVDKQHHKNQERRA